MPKLNDGLSPYKRLVKDWKDCTRCPLHKVRKQVVMVRGKIPAEVVFVGEAPGESEDVLGLPFIGPAGQLLDQMILKALVDAIEIPFGLGPAPTIAFCNLVGCIPKDANTKRKAVEPLPEEVEACWPRLDKFFAIAKPKIIFAVGTLADKYSKLKEWAKRSKVITIDHPAYLIRLDISRQGLEIQRNIVKMATAFGELADAQTN